MTTKEKKLKGKDSCRERLVSIIIDCEKDLDNLVCIEDLNTAVRSFSDKIVKSVFPEIGVEVTHKKGGRKKRLKPRLTCEVCINSKRIYMQAFRSWLRNPTDDALRSEYVLLEKVFRRHFRSCERN